MMMMNLKEEKIRVHYDVEKDAYYRINQEDGKMERSFKNGSPFKVFNADISGRDYKSRKKDKQWSIWAKPKICNQGNANTNNTNTKNNKSHQRTQPHA